MNVYSISSLSAILTPVGSVCRKSMERGHFQSDNLETRTHMKLVTLRRDQYPGYRPAVTNCRMTDEWGIRNDLEGGSGDLTEELS
jgi:hypothetical protein